MMIDDDDNIQQGLIYHQSQVSLAVNCVFKLKHILFIITTLTTDWTHRDTFHLIGTYAKLIQIVTLSFQRFTTNCLNET